jgi:hypothetical protein
MEPMKLFGVMGLLLIVTGILLNDRKKRNYFLIAGGVALEIYSIYLGDIIFIILQAVFIIAALFDVVRWRKKYAKTTH